jgi:hypothetical protein
MEIGRRAAVVSALNRRHKSDHLQAGTRHLEPSSVGRTRSKQRPRALRRAQNRAPLRYHDLSHLRRAWHAVEGPNIERLRWLFLWAMKVAATICRPGALRATLSGTNSTERNGRAALSGDILQQVKGRLCNADG